MSNNYAKTPTVYQMEATECGAASLAMVLGYYGKFVPLEQLRIETGVSRDGCNMGNIMTAAKKLGFEVHGYRKGLEGLFALPVPCIIHWNFNHFVVWEGRKGDHCYINDPAVGRRKLTVDDIDECYTGVVLTFKPTDAFEKSNEKESLWTFVRERLKGQKAGISALITLGFFLVIPGVVIPLFSKVFIDDILLGGNRDWLISLIAVMLFTMLFQAFLTYYRSTLLLRLQDKMILVNAYKFQSHMLRLPITFFSQRYAGDLSTRIENNNNISVFLTSNLAEAVLNSIVAPLYLVILLFFSPLLTLIALVFMVINLLLMNKAASYLSDMSMKAQQDQSKMIGTLFSGITVTDTLKASGTENEFVSRLQGNYAKSILMEQSMGYTQEMLNTIPEVSSNILNIVTLVVGGVLVIRGNMTAGMLVAYSSLLTSFTAPVNSLAGFIQNIQTTKADMARVNDIDKYKVDERYARDEYEKTDEKLTGSVELKDVSFGYDILKAPLVENFGFTLTPGKSVALVGASGSGKSTVAKLCSGLYAPWSGEILFDGCPSASVSPEVMSSSVSTVSQDIMMFSGSVRDNLTMWDRFIMDEDIVNAARDACIHDFIVSKPGAYEYHLTEGGSNLSGGQRQRIEIARALVSNPSILIMDEATSALDPIAEKQIIDNIKRRGCSCIIVAHRLSAIRDCDEIIVLENGRIVQRGTHEELSKVPGHYQRLIETM
ncbi:MAG: NHLP family bacteriocin export ABC transporter peptidase/permease/ATPase subunit [Clostridiales bacterium]|nr:NHLP family bacteriocin export ABC transporter peptidase/permease/ATPase subunit [Clostridiales bacterium]